MIKRKALFLFLLALVVVLPFQGTRPLMGRDENRYPEVARLMLIEGNYLLPHYHGHLHLTKPPLTYWAIVLGYKVAGVNPWGARLPNTIAYALTVLTVFLIGRELLDESFGMKGALMYLSMLFPFIAANIVTTDTLLVMWEALFLWAFLKGIREGKKRWFLLMWSFLGLAFLTKGMAVWPVASATFLFWFFKRKEFPNPFIFSGLVLFCLIALSWHLYVWIKVEGSFKVFWEEEIYGRLFSDMYHRNSKWYAIFYLYFPILTLGALPASIFWIKPFKNFSFNDFKEKLKEDWVSLFLWLHFLLPLFIFCIAKSRLPLYVLPLFVPLSLLSARVLPALPYPRVLLGCWLLLLILLKMGVSLYLSGHSLSL